MANVSNGYVSFSTNDLGGDVRHNDAEYIFNTLQNRNITQWGVDRVAITQRSPNITPYNNKLAVSDGLVSFPVEIPEGYYYDIDDLLTAIINALNASGFPSAFTYVVEANGSNTITNTTAFNFVERTDVGKNLASMLGWTVGIFGSVLNLSYNGWADLRYTPYVDICSNSINRKNPKDDYTTNGKTGDILARIYFTTAVAGNEEVQENTNVKYMKTDRFIDNNAMRICVRDAYGNLFYDPDNTLTYDILLLTR